MQKVVLCLLVVVVAGCAPKVGFELSDTSLRAPADVTFRNTSHGADSYEWSFGDGEASSEVSPRHRYLHSGDYTITLQASKGNKSREHTKTITVAAPETCLIEIQTPYGNMVAKLSDETPGHRDNFLKLAEEGYYDGLLFHRVINGFMIQGGDPDSRNAPAGKPLGSGGPGYQIPAEINRDLVHTKGAIAAARTSDAVNPEKKSSGSQFYIVQGRPMTEQELLMMEDRNGYQYTPEQREAYMKQGGTPFLDGEYTVFGQVIEGLDVIDAIARVQTDRNDRPNEDIPMKIVVIK